MIMGLKGSKGTITFTVFTGWYLPQTIDWWKSKGYATVESVKGWGTDIGYHSKQPIREWQTETNKSSDTCEWTDGSCWYDGSGLAGQELFNRFVVEGEEVVWKTLEEWYHSEFDSIVVPKTTKGAK
jgi:hypothetical protein